MGLLGTEADGPSVGFEGFVVVAAFAFLEARPSVADSLSHLAIQVQEAGPEEDSLLVFVDDETGTGGSGGAIIRRERLVGVVGGGFSEVGFSKSSSSDCGGRNCSTSETGAKHESATTDC